MSNFLKHWNRTAIVMILSATIGFVLAVLLPKEYAATVFIETAVDYNRTGSLEDLEQDRILGIAEDIINSDSVFSTVGEKVDHESVEELRERIRISRTNDQWSLTMVGNDPEGIAELALAWLDAAWNALTEAQTHAARAELLQEQVDVLEPCISLIGTASLPTVCYEKSFSEVQDEINRYSEAYSQEMVLSKGLSTAVRFGEKNPGALRLENASRTVAERTFFGAIAGLLLSFLFEWFHPDKEKIAVTKKEDEGSDG